MSTWTPTVVVTLDGTDVTGETIAGVKVHRGRDDVDAQPRPGYVVATLLDLDADLTRPRLDAPLTVKVDGYPLVTDADVSDVTVSMNARNVATHTVTALGKLARLHRADPDASYVQQKDGDRIAKILTKLKLIWKHATTYAETDGNWTEVTAAETWATIEPTPLDVQTPGRYELASVSTPGDPWGQAQRAANDGLGVIAELRDGGIRYTDAHGRTERAAAEGFLTLPAGSVVLPGMALTSSVVNLTNRVVVGYTGDLEAVAEDVAAQDARGGVLELSVDTTLVNATDAQARADRLLDLRSTDSASIETVRVALNGDLSVSNRNALLEIETGTPIRITGLPIALGTSFTGVVEALTWTVTRTTVDLDLQVSPWAFSEFLLTWQITPNTEPWQDVDPGTTWTTAQEIVTGA